MTILEKLKTTIPYLEGEISFFKHMIPSKKVKPKDKLPTDFTVHDFIENVRSNKHWKSIIEKGAFQFVVFYFDHVSISSRHCVTIGLDQGQKSPPITAHPTRS